MVVGVGGISKEGILRVSLGGFVLILSAHKWC